MSKAKISTTRTGGLKIETPQGIVKQIKHKNGTISVKLSWNKDFTPKYKTKFLKAQKYVDNTVLRLSEPYTPLITGTLIKTGILGTIVGSGEIVYLAPYAHDVYYNEKSGIGRPTGPLRGPKWFERMKADKKDEILKGARRLMKNDK